MQIASITTNEQGEYEYATEEDYLEQTLDFIIEKEGFERKNISCEIDRAEIQSDILLNELEKGTIEKTRIFGTIRNSKNRDPVKAASITLSIEGTQIAAITSDEQGEYEYTAEEDYTGQTLDFVIWKEGFIRKDISHEIDRFEIKSDFLMDKIEIKIKGKICDETDSPLDNASISFSIGSSTINLNSDKDGSFSFTIGQQFLNQTIGYEASRDGFKIKSGKLKLIEDLRCINLSKDIPINPDLNRWIKIAAVGITLAGIAIILLLIITGDKPTELSTDPDPMDFEFIPGTGPQTFSIWNDGDGTLEWDVSSDQDWIIVSPDSGTEDGTVSVIVNSGGMDPGRHTGIITVESNGGTETGTISLDIQNDRPPEIHSFRAYPEHIDGPEGETTLSWEVSGATNVIIDGVGPVEVSEGSIDTWVEKTTTFILRATNDAGILDVRTVTVTVEGETEDLPRIHSFTADPYSISAGEESTLCWDVSGATSVTIDGIGRVDPAGEKVVYPDETTLYILKATNEAGSVEANATIEAIVEISYLQVYGFNYGSNQWISLNIDGFEYDSIFIDSGNSFDFEIIELPLGYHDVEVFAEDDEFSYTDTVYIHPDETRELYVEIPNEEILPLPGISFVVSSNPIGAGETTLLSWYVWGATSITIDHEIGNVPFTGTYEISPIESTTYTLTATNEAGSVRETAECWVRELTAERVLTLTNIVAEGGNVWDGKWNYGNNVGDTLENKGKQAFLSFDISNIPEGSLIREFEADFSNYHTYGNPFDSLGCLRVYPQDFGKADPSDYYIDIPEGEILSYCSSEELNTQRRVPGIYALQENLGSTRFQLRLQFDEESNNNNDIDAVFFGITNRLIVEYEYEGE